MDVYSEAAFGAGSTRTGLSLRVWKGLRCAFGRHGRPHRTPPLTWGRFLKALSGLPPRPTLGSLWYLTRSLWELSGVNFAALPVGHVKDEKIRHMGGPVARHKRVFDRKT